MARSLLFQEGLSVDDLDAAVDSCSAVASIAKDEMSGPLKVLNKIRAAPGCKRNSLAFAA